MTKTKPADNLKPGDSFSPWPWTQSYTCVSITHGTSERWLLLHCKKDGTGQPTVLTLRSGETVNVDA